jgi:hypothetical protein
MTLPETDLDGLTVADHEDHHITVHDLLNKVLVDASVGDILAKVAAGTTAATVAGIQPQYVHANQVIEVAHTVAGDLIVTVDRFTRFVLVTASAHITGLAVTGMGDLGDLAGWFHLNLSATASINVDLTSADPEILVAGTVPATMVNTDVALLDVERWA